MLQNRKIETPVFLFNLKREINGKKYQYAGEYPNNKQFLEKMRRILNSNGYKLWIDYKSRKDDKKVVLWSRRY